MIVERGSTVSPYKSPESASSSGSFSTLKVVSGVIEYIMLKKRKNNNEKKETVLNFILSELLLRERHQN